MAPVADGLMGHLTHDSTVSGSTSTMDVVPSSSCTGELTVRPSLTVNKNQNKNKNINVFSFLFL
jgi:hypothetical protein